ncbi:YggS family pyridoxal phosphate-dependent enzyme [Bacillus sp. 2205SS5-2]|uniref:YggS family pyridoxal phosphate-dependent enzyme n=1 Tax=Bacillus sp. 2205SS5-2 TaxID=3109031 RepID=UPI0030040CA0
MSVSKNLVRIEKNIKKACLNSGRHVEDVKIIAVTKYASIQRTQEAVDAGLHHFGENREEGLLEKYEGINQDVHWHFIGSLQTRKVKNIIEKVRYIHSLDRMSLAKEIHKRSKKPISCFVQVNVSGEESKHGLAPENVVDFIKELQPYSNIIVEGLMTMAPHISNEDRLRTYFQSLRKVQRTVQNLQLTYAPCKELSMGMSNDYEIAIEEGATFVRIGTALVGDE